MKRFFLFLLAALTLLSACRPDLPQPSGPDPEAGTEARSFRAGQGETLCDFGSRTISLYYVKPEGWTPDRPLLLYFHGKGRRAEAICTALRESAEKAKVFLVCPLFPETAFPEYASGNMLGHDGNGKRVLQPREKWMFTALTRFAAELKQRTGAAGPFVVLGHSAGSQLLHRYVLFGDTRIFSSIYCANAGWYTLPEADIPFPYGLKGLPPGTCSLETAFLRPVTLLVGENDTKTSFGLRMTPRAAAQGKNRLERGRNFFASAERAARRQGITLRWTLETVPDTGHDSVKIGKYVLEKMIP